MPRDLKNFRVDRLSAFCYNGQRLFNNFVTIWLYLPGGLTNEEIMYVTGGDVFGRGCIFFNKRS